MPQHTDDIVIIQQVLRGQQNAYAILVERYQSYVFTLVLRYVNDRGLAEEISQDVFVKAYRSLKDFKGTSKFSTWLYAIVHTTCISQLRKKKDAAILLEQDKLTSVAANEHSHERAEQKLEQKSRKALLSAAIATLPEEDAQIITLIYLAEQTIEEVSSIMNITPNNVKVKLFRARQKLRTVLETKFTNEII